MGLGTVDQPDREDLIAAMEEMLLTLRMLREHMDSIVAVISVALEQQADLEELLRACRGAQYDLQSMGFYGRTDHPSIYEQLAIALREVLGG